MKRLASRYGEVIGLGTSEMKACDLVASNPSNIACIMDDATLMHEYLGSLMLDHPRPEREMW